jgi:hypothetical protein
MTKQEFERKVRKVFPDREINLGASEIGHWALIGALRFVNMVSSDKVYMYWWPSGNYAGDSKAVEQA